FPYTTLFRSQGGANVGLLRTGRGVLGLLHDIAQQVLVVGTVGTGRQGYKVGALAETVRDLPQLPLFEVVGVVQRLGDGGGTGERLFLAGQRVDQQVATEPVHANVVTCHSGFPVFYVMRVLAGGAVDALRGAARQAPPRPLILVGHVARTPTGAGSWRCSRR